MLDETSSDEASDAPLKALYDRYSELAYDQINAQEQASVQVMLKGPAWVSARKICKDSHRPR